MEKKEKGDHPKAWLEFKKNWFNRIDEIKKMSLSESQTKSVVEGFKLGAQFLQNKNLSDIDVIELVVDLRIALIKANNNYKREFPSFWNRFIKMKPPDINLLKKD